MNTDFQAALLEHTQRLANAFEHLNGLLERQNALLEAPDERPPAVDDQAPRHLSLFLENLPSRNYNHLRQKLIPAHLTAKILGLSQAQLACLDRHNFIKGKGGRYDVLGILDWLDSDYNPDTEAPNAQ